MYQEKFIGGYALNRAWQEIPANALIALVDTVRTRVLRFTIDLQEQVGESEVPLERIEPKAVEKAVKTTNRNSIQVPIAETSIPHTVEGRYGAARVVLIPALPGTGVIAGNTVRAVMDAAGVHDVLTKSRGSTNPMNLVRATNDALGKLRTKDQIARLRGVTIQ